MLEGDKAFKSTTAGRLLTWLESAGDKVFKPTVDKLIIWMYWENADSRLNLENVDSPPSINLNLQRLQRSSADQAFIALFEVPFPMPRKQDRPTTSGTNASQQTRNQRRQAPSATNAKTPTKEEEEGTTIPTPRVG